MEMNGFDVKKHAARPPRSRRGFFFLENDVFFFKSMPLGPAAPAGACFFLENDAFFGLPPGGGLFYF